MAPLTWQNDPLLLDSEPIVMNEWMTANKLLLTGALGTSSFIDMDTLTLHHFPLLVRKIDFIKEKDSDRILSRFPFLVLSKEEKELITKKILLVAEFTRDYFYKAINSKISVWRTRLQTYLDRGAIPYPLYRCACEVLNCSLLVQNRNRQLFESARGKRYSIPVKLSPTLAYLCGVINGDGHLHTHWLRVVDETKEHIELISSFFEKLFTDSGEIFQTGNAWNVELRSSSAVRLFNFLTDQTIQGAKYDALREPLLFKQLGEPYRSLYWRGVMDADGTFKNHISFSSASKHYVEDFREFLVLMNIKSTIYQMNNGAYLLTIPIDYKFSYARNIGTMNPKKRSDFIKLLNRKSVIFNGLNEVNIRKNGFFNFGKMSSLCVNGLGFYLKQFRGTKPFSQVESELGITRGQYSYYEKNKRAVPFSLFMNICQKQPKVEHFMQELNKYSDRLTFQTSNTPAIKLPLKPSKEVIRVMSHLLPLSTWTRILQPTHELRALIKGIFGITASGNKLKGNLIKNFLQTYGLYQEVDADKIISKTLI